ncbi:uncharacterized protein LOC132715302 [Ruditapes philippinarum]|uniref:uncharacterized protein LOC132715302 n=1 Tax=Ruditapes philippinarum TaxID=129788 RepID=UPI00295A8AED|nr:uncharacterized protein LOC132715302 [Ruditapes philippinarum]
MDVKFVLLVLAFINQMMLGSCCGKRRRRITHGPTYPCLTDPCTRRYRKRRSMHSTNMTETDLLQKIGTELNIIPVKNLCKFETYDMDSDGMIKQEELEAIFGIRKETKDLMTFMDFKDNDGMISVDEFCVAGPHLIRECEGYTCVKMNQIDTD